MSVPKVFLLEDEPSVCALIKDFAESEGWGFKCLDHCGGSVAAMREFQPDAVLLDVALPDGDGYEVCRQLRKDAALKKVPAIFLTAKGDVQSRLKGFEAGGQDYVSKPFDIRELRARLYAHLALKHEKDVLLREKDALLREKGVFLVRERLQQDMLDMVVHDLRTPLTTIKGTLEWVRTSGLISAGEYETLLKNAEDAAEWAIFMVNDMLDLHCGKLRVERRPLDFRELTQRLESLFHLQAQARRMPISFDWPAADPAVETDSMLVLRILANLLSNAIKFSPQNSPVRLGARRGSGGLRLEVEDRGPGIPDAEKERIFIKHYRLKEGGGQGVPGFGIGLAFCRLAAGALEGRIWVEDAAPMGSRFVLDIPA